MIHDKAMLAAQAVEAAGRQGKFWEMSDLIFERQQKWKAKKLAKNAFVYYAKKLNLNVKKFKRDLERRLVKNRINADAERAVFLEVKGTPTVFLNGKEFDFAQLDDLERIIKENLNE